MNNREAINALRAAEEEIISLRRRNELLQAKVDMVELFRTVLLTQPHQDRNGAAEDPLGKIRRLARDLEDDEAERNINQVGEK